MHSPLCYIFSVLQEAVALIPQRMNCHDDLC
jgi:hypothetical protein